MSEVLAEDSLLGHEALFFSIMSNFSTVMS